MGADNVEDFVEGLLKIGLLVGSNFMLCGIEDDVGMRDFELKNGVGGPGAGGI